MISVLVLTKDEGRDLPQCLTSVSWSDDIHVFDSFSTDNTVEIAAAAGARVTQRIFDGYAAQRNAALHGLAFRHPWVLILDADERVPEQLAVEMCSAVRAAADDVAGFRVRRRDFLGTQWLKYSQISPFFIRLVRPHRAMYEREINEVLTVDGAVRDLSQAFDHFPFSKGLSHWIRRHDVYSTMEAERSVQERDERFVFSWRKAFAARDFNVRRYHQKGLFYRMPARPLLKWLYMVVWRRGFLDGGAGMTYATLQAFYEYMIVLKANELRARKVPVCYVRGR